MEFDKVEDYLKKLGEKERDMRACLTDPKSPRDNRKDTLAIIDEIEKRIHGYTLAITHLCGKEKGEYYKMFYDQARSLDGIP